MMMDSKGAGAEAQQYVWGGAIPLQIHLHDAEVTTLPPPPPALVFSFILYVIISFEVLFHLFEFLCVELSF